MAKAFVPLLVDRKLKIFVTPIDISYLQQVRANVTCLICAIIDSISSVGLQSPGSAGPGELIWACG